MNFLYPYALWGLAGLCLPIIVHMLSKREKSVVNFGSIRFLKASESDAARSVGLSQYFLLILRLLFIGLICFLMAQPILRDDSKVISYWIEEGALGGGDYDELLSEINEDANIYCFSFSDDDTEDCSYFTSGWQLIDRLNKQKDSTVVYSYSYLKYFKGDPIRLVRNVEWNILPRKEEINEVQRAKNEGVVTEWRVSSEANKTSVVYKTENLESNYKNIRSLALSLISEEVNSSKRLRTIIDNTSEFLKYPISWDEEEAEVQVVVSEKLKQSKPNSINWIPSNKKLKIEYGLENRLLLKGKLTKDEVLASNLPVVISGHLNKIYTQLNDYDWRVLDPTSFFAETTTTTQVNGIEDQRRRSLGLSWWLLVIPLLLIERAVYLNAPNS